LGKDNEGKDVFLREIWPSREEVEALADKIITPEMFAENYTRKIAVGKAGNEKWHSIVVKGGLQYEW